MQSDLFFEERQIQNIIKESNARIVTVNQDFFVIEKSGQKRRIELSTRELKSFGICSLHVLDVLQYQEQPMEISQMLTAFN